MSTAAVALALAVLLPLGALFATSRLVRLVAARNARRRPIETALVILGSLLGTAIITGSLVVGDTLDWSVGRLAETRLGPVDETISTFDPRVAGPLLERLPDIRAQEHVDGAISMMALPAPLLGPGEQRRAAPRAQLLEVDFATARAFGNDPAATGILGRTPAPGRVVLNQDLADQLDVRVGSRVSAHVYGSELRLVVDRVLPQIGLAGYQATTRTVAHNAFVAPGTVFPLFVASGGLGVPPEQIVAVSNTGGVKSGASHTDEVLGGLTRLVTDLQLSPRPVKRDVLDEAQSLSTQLGGLFLAMGSFGVLAGVLLLVNLFTMLTEERRSELGMLRALGATRGALVSSFAAEGCLYALVAAGLGTFAGLGLGRVIVVAVSRAIGGLDEQIALRLDFWFDWTSVQLGFAAGLAIGAATVVGASLRVANLGIIAAIREINEPQRARRSIAWRVVLVVAAVVAAAWGAVGVVSNDDVAALLGPVLALAAIATLLGTRRSYPAVVSAAALATIAWEMAAMRWLASRQVGGIDVVLFVLQGTILTFAAVTLVTAQQHRVGGLLKRLFPAHRALSVHLGLAYPLARRGRTWLTVAIYALVISTLSFVTVLSAVIDGELDRGVARLGGAYDVIVSSSVGNPVTPEHLASREGVRHVAPLAQGAVAVSVPSMADTLPQLYAVSRFDERLLAARPPKLSNRGAYRSDLDAYRAVLADTRLVIADLILASVLERTTGGSIAVGSTLVLRDPSSGRNRTVEVAALGPTDLAFNGILVGSTDGLLATAPPTTRAYLDLAPGIDARAFSLRLMNDLASNGTRAEPVQAIVESAAAAERQFFDLARGYLGLGLVVGVAGIGVVMVRAVRERRRQIAVLRSLGMLPGRVRQIFIAETTFVAAEGTIIGVVLACVNAYNIITSTDLLGRRPTFALPVAELAVLSLATLAVSLAATAYPTRAAAKILPAVALRVAD